VRLLWKRLFGVGRERGEGLSATWWAIGAAAGAIGGIVLVAQADWWGLLLVIAGVWQGLLSFQRAREGNVL
jgi:hypothetical protein